MKAGRAALFGSGERVVYSGMEALGMLTLEGEMTRVGWQDFVSCETALIGGLMSYYPRPNLLLSAAGHLRGAVADRIQALCASPCHLCRLPGPLTLPSQAARVFLIDDVATLTLGQQIQLFDWTSERRPGVQVVSISTPSLWHRVEEGRFLECLYYRLNTVSIDLTAGADFVSRAGSIRHLAQPS